MSRCGTRALVILLAVGLLRSIGCDGGAAPQPSADKHAPANPLAADPAANPLAGAFKGPTLELELRPDDDGFSGTIVHRGKLYPVRARQRDDRLAGTFAVDGADLAFTARAEGDTMTLESGGATHTMRRVAAATPVNPLAQTTPIGPLSKLADAAAQPPVTEIASPAPVTPAPAPAPTIPTPPANAVALQRLEMQSFKHAVGFTFEYPRGWTAQDADGAVLIVPPDAKRDAQGQPLEALYIASEDAAQINDPADPQVLAYLDNMITQMMPAMRRTGDPATIQTVLGAGSSVMYEGELPTGIEGRVDVYTTLHRGNGVFLVHLGQKDLVAARREVAGRIFASFGWGQGQLDPHLVGVWKRQEQEGTDVRADGYIGSRTSKTWAFGQDGAAVYGVSSRIFGHTTGGGGQITIDPTASENVSKGAWSAGNGRLYILWDTGGSETWEYKVFPHTDNQTALKLTTPGNPKPLYFIRQ